MGDFKDIWTRFRRGMRDEAAKPAAMKRKELAVEVGATLCPALMVPSWAGAVAAKDEPTRLAKIDMDSFGKGLLINGFAGCALAKEAFAAPHLGIAMAAIWLCLNAIAAASVVWVVMKSRLKNKDVWERLDFIEKHAPPPWSHRAPETADEYRALEMIRAS